MHSPHNVRSCTRVTIGRLSCANIGLAAGKAIRRKRVNVRSAARSIFRGTPGTSRSRSTSDAHGKHTNWETRRSNPITLPCPRLSPARGPRGDGVVRAGIAREWGSPGRGGTSLPPRRRAVVRATPALHR
jgi:hypothetical protein